MHQSILALAATPIVFLTLAAAPAAQAEFRAAPVVFDRVSDSGPFGTVELSFDVVSENPIEPAAS